MEGNFINDLVQMTGSIFPIGIMIAGPMMTISFVLLLLFSFLGRAVPQMNVFSESFSFRILTGLIVLGHDVWIDGRAYRSIHSRYPDRLNEYC